MYVPRKTSNHKKKPQGTDVHNPGKHVRMDEERWYDFSCIWLVRKVLLFMKEWAVMSWSFASMNHLDVIHMKNRSGRKGLDLVSQ